MSAPGKDGGPAFPHVNPNYDGNWDKEPQRAGMSIRDWFAGQALAGLSTATDADGQWQSDPSGLAKESYAIADAMLKEREK